MSVAIVGKLLGGLVVSSSGIAAITYMVINSNAHIELDKQPNNNIYIYAINKEVVVVADDDGKDSKTNKNYKCKFDSKYYECELSAIEDFDGKTKQIDIAKLINTSTAIQTINKDTLKTKGTIYKILINSKIGDWTNTSSEQNNQKTLSIDITSKTDPSKEYASLKPLFAIKSDELSDKYTKTKYFVVQNKVSPASASAVGAAASTSTYTCSTTNDQNVETKNESCDVYDFSDGVDANNKTLHELVFKKPVTPTTDTSFSTANKYYLVQLKTSVQANEVTQIKITSSTGTDVLLESIKIIPAIHITEKAEGIFILQKNPAHKQAPKLNNP